MGPNRPSLLLAGAIDAQRRFRPCFKARGSDFAATADALTIGAGRDPLQCAVDRRDLAAKQQSLCFERGVVLHFNRLLGRICVQRFSKILLDPFKTRLQFGHLCFETRLVDHGPAPVPLRCRQVWKPAERQSIPVRSRLRSARSSQYQLVQSPALSHPPQMMRSALALALAVVTTAPALLPASARAQARPPLPAAVLTHMNGLDARCTAAGGKPGSGRYVIAQDFTGDGLLDYLLSEGDYDCTGRPGLFRTEGQARVDIFVTDRAGAARRIYSDRLIAYRVLAGRPARVQIARKGALCGAETPPQGQCAAQLAWNGTSFGEAASVSRGGSGASSGPVAMPEAAPGATSEASFLASCRADLIRRDASAARWANDECRTNWQKIVASGPAADMLLAVLPATAGGKPTLGETKQRAAAVRWATRANPPALATGTLGQLSAAIEGRGSPATVSVSWAKVGTEIPYEIVGALRVRGLAITEMSCEKVGVGAGTRTYAGTSAERVPFTLIIDQQTAPLGHMQSYYTATVSLEARHPPRGSTTGCDF